jgi:hypothetical protein
MRHIEVEKSRMLANALYSLCNEGASLSWNFESPTSGYMVSKVAGPVFESVSAVCTSEVKRFIEANLTTNKNTYFGVWTDKETGKVYFDQSVRVSDLIEAKDIAGSLKQIAIYDLNQGKEIRI